MIIDFEFGCSEETKNYYVAEETDEGIETVGERNVADDNFDLGICGDLSEDVDDKLMYHICEKCEKEMREFGAFPESLPEPVKSIKAKLEKMGYSPLWLEDEVEVEIGINISMIDGNNKSFYVHIGINVDCELTPEKLTTVNNISLSEIDDENCDYNIDCAKLFNSVDDLSKKSLEAYEVEIDTIIDDVLLK